MLSPHSKLQSTMIAMYAFAVILLAAPASSYAQNQDWQADLRRQLLTEYDCQLNYLTNVRTFELLGRVTIKARAHCTDGQAFDVSRSGEEKAFKVQSSSIIEC